MSRQIYLIALAFCLLTLPVRAADPLPRLKVSGNHRFLVTDKGEPFFYLGDTAWELFHRLNRADTETYLDDRAAKGFTAIQAVVLAEFDGLTEPNANGDLPLENNDPTKPIEKYFQHVDWVVDQMNRRGMYCAMLPTWGDKVNKKWGKGPEIFTPENARVFGEYLGKRYKDKGIIWMLGGDRPVEKPVHLEVWRAMAAGIRAGDGGQHLITYHPMGEQSSANYCHDEPWLDFNTLQSGHGRKNNVSFEMIRRDYERKPTKPCMDSEPNYENHPERSVKNGGWFDDYDVRKTLYWTLFAGGHGYTYGCHDIWMMWDKGKNKNLADARTGWREAIKLPGSTQVGIAKKLMLSKPFLTRIPDQSLIVGDPGKGGDHVQATRDTEGRYAMVYVPSGKPVTVDLTKLNGKTIRGSWFDPRTGTSRPMDVPFKNGASQEFKPPATEGERDWVLVLESEE